MSFQQQLMHAARVDTSTTATSVALRLGAADEMRMAASVGVFNVNIPSKDHNFPYVDFYPS